MRGSGEAEWRGKGVRVCGSGCAGVWVRVYGCVGPGGRVAAARVQPNTTDGEQLSAAGLYILCSYAVGGLDD